MTGAVALTNSPRWPAVTARMVSCCWLNPRTTSGRFVPQRDGACYDEAVRAWEASCRLAVLRTEAANSIQPLLVHLLDGSTADLQSLGQFPLAHSLRPLHPDVLPLLLGQARPSAKETLLGPRLRLASDRAFPDRVPLTFLNEATRPARLIVVDHLPATWCFPAHFLHLVWSGMAGSPQCLQIPRALALSRFSCLYFLSASLRSGRCPRRRS